MLGLIKKRLFRRKKADGKVGLRKVDVFMNETLTINQRIKRLEKAVFGEEGKPGYTKECGEGLGLCRSTGGVRFLNLERLLQEKKALAEIRLALAQRDYHYSKQAVHEALKRLIQKDGPLVCLLEGGKKMYVNRN